MCNYNIIIVYCGHGGKFSCSFNFIILGTSIRLSPLEMVSVCPGGQVLLTCETMSDPFLYWDVSILHLAMSREIIVSNLGAISTTALQFNGLHLTEFNVIRTSGSPLISQLLISNVTTEINGSTIYCSEDGDEDSAPMTEINVKNKGRIILENAIVMIITY